MESGYGDIDININQTVIRSVKSILSMRNPIFKQLIKDSQNEKVISLNLSITTELFLEIEKYYGGGTIIVDEHNIMDILKFCYFYEEYNLFMKCKYFIVNHMTNELMMEVLKFVSLIQTKEFGDIKNDIDVFYKLHSYIYFDDNNYLNFELESLEYILALQHIIIKSENYLLDKIIDYYNNKSGSESENQILFQYINMQALDMNRLKQKTMKLLVSSMPSDENNQTINIIERCYLNPPEILNTDLRDIILQYYIRDYPIFNIDCIYLYLFIDFLGDKLHYCDCKNEIIELITNIVDIKIIIILVLIIMELKYELDEDIQVKIRSVLLSEYNKCDNNNKKESIVKCLTLCVNDCIYIYYCFLYIYS